MKRVSAFRNEVNSQLFKEAKIDVAVRCRKDDDDKNMAEIILRCNEGK